LSSLVKPRGRGNPHKKMEQRRGGNPVIVIDYKTFAVEGAEKREDSEDAEAQTKAIVMRHQGTGMLVGHMVERKGDKDQWVVQRLVDDLASWGCTDVVLKTDGEPSIVALQKAMAASRQHETIPVHPSAHSRIAMELLNVQSRSSLHSYAASS